jgi:hypothetical protein
VHTGARCCVRLARDYIASQTLSGSVPLCCFENRDFKLTNSNRSVKIRQSPLLTAQSAFPLETSCFSPTQGIVHTGLFEKLPPRAFVERKRVDIQLLTNLKLRGNHLGFTEKTQNETDD